MTDRTSTSLQPFYTIKQLAAERWWVSTKTLRRLINRGDLIATRIGGQIRIKAEDVLAYERLHRG